ncbi:hypothetical protein FACS189437_10220 [Bacteroidia bacterium]|nr:hypothetical protein FACS189437_10220 [Bacteroidia bacterium]
MEKVIIVALFSLVLITISSCKQGKNNNTNNDMETKLVDGLDLEKFQSEYLDGSGMDFQFHSVKYDGEYIENLQIKNLLNREYLIQCMKALDSENEEDTQLPIVAGLLVARMEQLYDKNAYLILCYMSEDPNWAYSSSNLYSGKLLNLFLMQPAFFVNSAYDLDNIALMKTIYIDGYAGLRSDVDSEPYFESQIAALGNTNYSTIASGQVLAQASFVEDSYFSESPILQQALSQKKVQVYINPGPGVGNDWQGMYTYYYDIRKPICEVLKQEVAGKVYDYYMEKIDPLFNSIEIRNYYVQDKDGYVNVRSGPDVHSTIEGTIQNSEYVCYLGEENEDWVKISHGSLMGYIHKSRLVRK